MRNKKGRDEIRSGGRACLIFRCGDFYPLSCGRYLSNDTYNVYMIFKILLNVLDMKRLWKSLLRVYKLRATFITLGNFS